MNFKSIVLVATTLVLSTRVDAALITNLYNLDINGINYDATFHTGPGDSFNALWDADDDGVFGGGSSAFTNAPTFWGDISGARDAASAIAIALGTTDVTTNGTDGFLIPYDHPSGSDIIRVWYDTQATPGIDVLARGERVDGLVYGTDPYVSFSISSVPVPAAVWLFGSGLLGLIGFARRKV